MNILTGQVYEFGEFRLDATERLLLRDGSAVALTPRAFDTLVILVQNGGHVLTRDELLEQVWHDSFVEENTLTQNVAALRKALGERHNGQPYIETVPKVGYRFVAEVRTIGGDTGEVLVERHTRERVLIKTQETVAYDDAQDDQAFNPQPLGLIGSAKKYRGLSIAAVAVVLIGIAATALLISGSSKPGEPGAPIKSIAVLPFKNLSPDGGDEYLGVGIADALTTRLGRFKQIIVRPTNAVYKYREVGQDPVAAGRELGVEAVLDGSIYKSGEKIRVTMQLVRVRDNATLWTDRFDGKLTDLFKVQDSISSHVSQAMALTLLSHDKELLEKRYTSNIEAYQEYLKGRYFWSKRTQEGFAKSIEHFERAIALDPDYALAYAGIADTLILCDLPLSGVVMMKYSSAKEAARKALALDETLAEAHANMAYYQSALERNWTEAEKGFQQAINLNPNYATAHHWYAYHLASVGRMDQAIAEINEALKIDPLSLIINTDVGHMLYLARRYDEAVATYRRVLDMDPNFTAAHLRLGEAYIQKRTYQAAIAELQIAMKLSGRASTELAWLGYVYAVSGRTAEALREIERLNKLSIRHHRRPYLMAVVFAGLGEKDRAFSSLENAYETGDAEIALYKVEPLLDPLRSDSRYNDLLRRMGLAQ